MSSILPPKRIVIASRQSRLAMWQSEHVRSALRALYPECDVQILGMSTQGDRILDVSLSKIGGKGLFVKELESALADGRADIAVHSAKDVPMELPDGFMLAAIGERADARDCLVSNTVFSLAELSAGSVVGTSSLRREAQIRERYPRLRIAPLRGNVDTRLARLDGGDYQAIVLAAAGLRRLGLESRMRALLPVEESLPAPGQGALAIECRAGRDDIKAWLAPLHHPATAACVRAERAMSRALSGSCQLPLAAYAEGPGTQFTQLTLRGLVARPDGSSVLRARASGAWESPEALGEAVAGELRSLGAGSIIAALS